MSTASLSLNSRLAPMSMKAFMFLSRNDPFVVARHEVHQSARSAKGFASDSECMEGSANAHRTGGIERKNEIGLGSDLHHVLTLFLETCLDRMGLGEDSQQRGQGRVAV